MTGPYPGPSTTLVSALVLQARGYRRATHPHNEGCYVEQGRALSYSTIKTPLGSVQALFAMYLGIYVGCQPVWRAVGQVQRLLLGCEWCDRRDGPKNLLLKSTHGWGDPCMAKVRQDSMLTASLLPAGGALGLA